MSRTLWRLYRARHGPGLDGIGGTLASGRWNRLGERVVYFGTTAAIVVLERLAHTAADLLPDDLRLGRFEIHGADVTRVEQTAELPPRWESDEELTRRIAKSWRDSAVSCLLEVPSAILPEERNIVLNPLHPAAVAVRLVHERPFGFDPRLL